MFCPQLYILQHPPLSRMTLKGSPSFGLLLLLLLIVPFLAAPHDGLLYDFSAYTKCKAQPVKPLYNGGILKDQPPDFQHDLANSSSGVYSPSFALHNLTQTTIYCFSCWVKIYGADSARIRASLKTDHITYNCIGTVTAKTGCWSFLKGGFVLNSTSNSSRLFFQSSDAKNISVAVASASLQPFTAEQWRTNQQYMINKKRKRAVTIHVADGHGNRMQGATITVEQISKDFPIGNMISKTIIGNLPNQNWFVKRFKATVFGNDLKWYVTEPRRGQVNYTIADQMMEFVRANKLIARGHNIFWDSPVVTPSWVRNLTSSELQSAIDSRIQSVMGRYKGEFIHWDVNNEMLHSDFYEQRLGPNASLHFFQTAHQLDPLATLFMNDYSVVETCNDANSTVDAYISRIRGLKQGGVAMDGIGLESHFNIPNPPLIRAILDKFATLGLPIWLTELDISKTQDKETQAIYLEKVLREAFSHPAVTGIMIWSALDQNGTCYEMCLTDTNYKNLPAGDMVDKLLKEWQTEKVDGQTDEHGSYSFFGFLGEYQVNVNCGNKTTNTTFSVCPGRETKHFRIQL